MDSRDAENGIGKSNCTADTIAGKRWERLQVYMPKTIEELNQVRDECQSMVTKRAGVSGITAIIPIPGADVAADIGMLLQLLPAINKKFGLSSEQVDQMDDKTKMLVLEIAKKLGNTIVGKLITKELVAQPVKNVATRMVTKQVVKYIPVLGQIASASISFAAMKYVGNSHVNECYQIVHQILASKQQDIFDAEFVEKQEEENNAPDLSKEKTEVAFDKSLILDAIRELKEMRDQEIIDENEFQTKKKELLDKLKAERLDKKTLLETIKELKELRDLEIVDEEEFRKKKKELLAEL